MVSEEQNLGPSWLAGPPQESWNFSQGFGLWDLDWLIGMASGIVLVFSWPTPEANHPSLHRLQTLECPNTMAVPSYQG